MGILDDYRAAKERNIALVTEHGAQQGMYGGGPDQADAYRQQWLGGIGSGARQVDQGMLGLQGSARMGAEIYGQGAGMAQAGLGYADQARAQQMGALGLQRDAAMGQAPSQAQMLMQGAQTQQARQMMAAAQAARGGNQAAAMRNAQYEAASGNAQTQQQMAALRANEMAQARGAYGDMSGQIRGQDMGLAGMGLGAQTAGMQGVGQAGAQMGQIGAGREGNYLGTFSNQLQNEAAARMQVNRDIAAQRQGQKAAQAAQTGQLIGTAGAVVGGIYGGPAGAAAGGAAGNMVGKKVAT